MRGSVPQSVFFTLLHAGSALCPLPLAGIAARPCRQFSVFPAKALPPFHDSHPRAAPLHKQTDKKKSRSQGSPSPLYGPSASPTHFPASADSALAWGFCRGAVTAARLTSIVVGEKNRHNVTQSSQRGGGWQHQRGGPASGATRGSKPIMGRERCRPVRDPKD